MPSCEIDDSVRYGLLVQRRLAETVQRWAVAERGERQRREDRRGAQGAGARPGRRPQPRQRPAEPGSAEPAGGLCGGGGLLFGAGGTCSGGGGLLFGAQALVPALRNGGRACRQRGGGAAARAVGVVVRSEAGT